MARGEEAEMAARREDPEARTGPAAGDPQRMSEALGDALAACNLDLAAPIARIGDDWTSIVGGEIAAHCRPIGMKGGVLQVDVDSSVWCQQLQLRSPEILAALRRHFGTVAPEDLRFRVGYVPGPTRPAPSREPASERESLE